MWTEAEHFANWYGPMGATIPKADMDVRVGGRRHIAMEMETPSGPMQMFFVGEYREVEPKTRLVYTEAIADADGNAMTAEQMGMPAGAPTETSIVVELEDLGDRTKMIMTHIGVPADSPGGQAGRWRSTNSVHASLNSETAIEPHSDDLFPELTEMRSTTRRRNRSRRSSRTRFRVHRLFTDPQFARSDGSRPASLMARWFLAASSTISRRGS